jgi:heat shock protein HslJ
VLCGVVSAAPTSAGRRGKQRTPAAEVPALALPEATKPPATVLDGTRWQLQSYRGSNGETVGPLEGARPTIRFRDGQIITGSGGCNTFTAGYTYDDGRLTVSHPATTSKSCAEPAMDQEGAYLAALHHVARFTLSENTLTLDDTRGTTLFTFEHEPPPVIVGTDWRLTAYNDGKGGFVPALRHVTVTATFGADGKLTGSGGCNEYRGKYTQTGENLLIGTLILMTRKACPADTRDQERAYLAGLRSATRAESAGGQLLLTRAGDTRVASYTASAPAP